MRFTFCCNGRTAMRSCFHNSDSESKRGGIQNSEATEIRAVKPAVARQQPVSLEKRMCPDQEICHHACPAPAALPVGSPRDACFQGSFHGQRAELEGQELQGMFSCPGRGERTNNLCPHDLASKQLTF